jgi:4-amino-4-deoxychorismate lyase
MAAAPARLLLDGQMQGTISPLDRGLLYGDGLFETIRFVAGIAPLWARHMHRLQRGCERLNLPAVDVAQLQGEALSVSDGMADAVVRITITRGLGKRGYALPANPQPTRLVTAFAPPPSQPGDYRDGVNARLCALRLASQPLLAGIKHLNRLEQVLARAEWSDPAVFEGLLCDEAGRVISATMANLFAVIDGVLVTPALDRCGVEGVARAEILAMGRAQVRDLPLDLLWQAEEVFLSSSVRGILPLRTVGEMAFAAGPHTRALQQHWRDLGFSGSQA